MDFTPLLAHAWRVAWRHRRLWLLALIASGSVSGFTLPSLGNPAASFRDQPGFPAGPGAPPRLPPMAAIEAGVSQALASFNQYVTVVLAVGLIWLALWLALLVLGVTSQGALSWATLQLARDQPAPRRAAWTEGRRLFWRYLGLWLIAAFVGLLLFVGPVLYAAFNRQDSSPFGWFRAYVSAVSSPFFSASTIVLVPLYIILAYAKRAITYENAGVRRALAAGWRTLRSHFGSSLLAWLLNFGFYLAAFFVFFIALAVLSLLAVIAVALVAHGLPRGMESLAGGVAPYVAAGVLVAFGLFMLTVAIISLFLWSFWSQVYLRLNVPRYNPESIAIG